MFSVADSFLPASHHVRTRKLPVVQVGNSCSLEQPQRCVSASVFLWNFDVIGASELCLMMYCEGVHAFRVSAGKCQHAFHMLYVPVSRKAPPINIAEGSTAEVYPGCQSK